MKIINQIKLLKILPCVVILSGCVTATGDSHRADVYTSGQVNQRQEVKTVEMIAVLPARVEVDNSEAKARAQIGASLLGALVGGVVGANSGGDTNEGLLGGAVIGGVGGAAAGTMVPDKVLVDGVSLTYSYEGKTFNSAQVGELCEYKLGTAIMLSQDDKETRIQPNASCPEGEG